MERLANWQCRILADALAARLLQVGKVKVSAVSPRVNIGISGEAALLELFLQQLCL